MKKNMPAVFLDRDGTLIHEAHYLKELKDLKPFDETYEAIKKLNQNNILAIMVSNQSGVARGYFDEENVKFLNTSLNNMLKDKGAYLDGFYYCPHHPKGIVEKYSKICDCRKPKKGLIDQALVDFPEIVLESSYVVGDKPCDIELAKNSQCKSVFVKTGHGEDFDTSLIKADYIAKGIKEAIESILSDISI